MVKNITMSIEKKILDEISRYQNISSYLNEQGLGEVPAEDTPEEGGEMDVASDEGAEEIPEPIDVESDPDVEIVDDEESTEDVPDMGGESASTEELDVTELVTTQKNISDKQDEYMDTMFQKLDSLTNKLEDMDKILMKINDLEQKVEKMKPKTPTERLQLRSLDSYPYNQKLTDFFQDKENELEASGKNEYVLTSDDVENYSESDIAKSFDKPFEEL